MATTFSNRATATATAAAARLEEGLLSPRDGAAGEHDHGRDHGDAHSSPCFPRGSVVSSTFILGCVSLGVGVFSFPAVFRLSGIGGGSLLLLAFAMMSARAQHLVVSAANIVGEKTYEGTTKRVLGRWGFMCQTASIAVSSFIANCAHLQAVGSLLGDLLIWFVTGKGSENNDEFHLAKSRKAVLYILLLSIALPFCFQDDLNSLRYISTASVTAVMMNTMWFVVYCLWLVGTEQSPVHGGDASDWPPSVTGEWKTLPAFSDSPTDYFRSAGAVCFAFSSIVTLFPTVREMNQPQRIGQAVNWSSALCFTVYIATALAGAFAFGTGAESNCLYNTNVKHRDTLRPLVFVLVVCIILLYPVINYPMVQSLQTLIWGGGSSPEWSRPAISIVGVLGVAVVDFYVSDLVDLFGLCGSLGLGVIAYILPAVLFLRTGRGRWYEPSKRVAVVILGVGLLVTSVSTAFTVRHIVQTRP